MFPFPFDGRMSTAPRTDGAVESRLPSTLAVPRPVANTGMKNLCTTPVAVDNPQSGRTRSAVDCRNLPFNRRT